MSAFFLTGTVARTSRPPAEAADVHGGGGCAGFRAGDGSDRLPARARQRPAARPTQAGLPAPGALTRRTVVDTASTHRPYSEHGRQQRERRCPSGGTVGLG